MISFSIRVRARNPTHDNFHLFYNLALGNKKKENSSLFLSFFFPFLFARRLKKLVIYLILKLKSLLISVFAYVYGVCKCMYMCVCLCAWVHVFTCQGMHVEAEDSLHRYWSSISPFVWDGGLYGWPLCLQVWLTHVPLRKRLEALFHLAVSALSSHFQT